VRVHDGIDDGLADGELLRSSNADAYGCGHANANGDSNSNRNRNADSNADARGAPCRRVAQRDGRNVLGSCEYIVGGVCWRH
jgi:hypothetical protein